MKKLLILLFSIFLLSSPSVFADDISDFEIEGISVGDSLLDYMTEEEILEEIETSISRNDNHYLREPLKYLDVYLNKDLQVYKNGLSFYVKNNSQNKYVTNNNEKYKILFVRGLISYNEDYDNCIAKRDEIAEILSKMFPEAKKQKNFFISKNDPSGESTFDEVNFWFTSGEKIGVKCNNWKETFRIKNNYSEGLSVVIQTKEIFEWLTDY
jgi:hypothetical protein